MMSQRSLAALLISVLCVTGCASQYTMVSRTEVRTVKTDEGDEIKTEEKEYISFAEVIERSPNVKSVTRMTDLKGERQPGYFDVAFSDDWLVFQMREQSEGGLLFNLWKMSTTGGPGLTRLTMGQYYDMEPTFSSSGREVVFSSNRSSRSPKLCRVKVDGAGGITRVTSSEAEDRFPSVDSASGQIYYSSQPYNASMGQIWRVTGTGALPTQLKEGLWPRVSPDGSRVLYCVQDQKTRRCKIWIMNADGTGETQLTSDQESDDWYPSWSPDGTRVVYASDIGKDSNGRRNFDIWLMSADGSGKTQLTTNGSTDIVPHFSRDGRRIYFLSNRGNPWDIWRMEIID